MPLESPLTEREERLLHQVEPSLSKNPPGIDLPAVLRRFAVSIQTEIDSGGGGGAVDSVFSRTGDVLAEDADYTAAQVVYDPATSGLTATRVQAAIDEVVADVSAGTGVGLNIVGNFHASGVFVTSSAAAVVMAGAGADDDMEYTVPVGGDGDYMVIASGNIRTTDPPRTAFANLAKNGASVNGSDREHSGDAFVPFATQDVFTGLVAGDTLSARLRRAVGGGPAYDVEVSSRSMLVVKVG